MNGNTDKRNHFNMLPQNVHLQHTGLVLEGGGMRGVYTSGVLKFLMEKNIFFPYVIGVSMGACNAANYVSRQPERNKRVNIGFVNDSRFLSYKRLLLKGELFGMDFIFDTIPNSLVSFDIETFLNNDQICITTATDCHSGKAVYYEKKELGGDYLKVLRASASLPFVTRPVKYNGRILMDGGLSDPVPVRKSIEDGNNKNVIILTQPEGYRKEKSMITKLAHIRYYKYPDFCNTFENRARVYNKTMDLIDQLEKQKKVFVIRPELKLNAGRAERNTDKLYQIYDQGHKDMSHIYKKLLNYLHEDITHT